MSSNLVDHPFIFTLGDESELQLSLVQEQFPLDRYVNGRKYSRVIFGNIVEASDGRFYGHLAINWLEKKVLVKIYEKPPRCLYKMDLNIKVDDKNAWTHSTEYAFKEMLYYLWIPNFKKSSVLLDIKVNVRALYSTRNIIYSAEPMIGHTEFVLRTLFKMFHEFETMDFSINGDFEQPVRVHRAVMLCQSFKMKLAMKHHAEMTISGVSRASVLSFVSAMYCGQCESDLQSLSGVLVIAKRYAIAWMQEYAFEHLLKLLTSRCDCLVSRKKCLSKKINKAPESGLWKNLLQVNKECADYIVEMVSTKDGASES